VSETRPTARPGAAAERVLGVALVAALAAILLYAPRLWLGGHGFVNYDDPYLTAADNPAIGMGLAGWLRMLGSGGYELWDLTQWVFAGPFGWVPPAREPQFMNAWLPLYYGSLGLDHALFGDSPLGWHLHSVLLHAAGAAMVAVLGRRLGLGAVGAAVAGVAFAVHPALTENVAWIASRKDVLSFLWMTFAAWAYLEAIRRGKPALHAVGALCLAVSLTAKGTTLVLPLLLVVHALLVRTDAAPRRERLRAIVPYGVVALVLTAVHLWVARREGTAGGGTGAGVGSVLLANLDVVGRYAVLLLAPFPPIFRQSVEHGVDPNAIDSARVAVGCVALVAWAAATWWAWGRRPRLAAVLLCVPLALAPFNNVFPRTSVLFAERYAQVAVLPVALALGALATGVGNRPLVAAVATTAFAAFAWLRLPVWHDAVTLWEDAATAAPASALVRLQLADAYGTRARTEPDAADAWNAKGESAWREAVSHATDELSRMRAEAGLGTHLVTTAPGGATTEQRLRESVALLASAERRLAAIDAPGPRATQLSTIRVNRAVARETLGETDAALEDWKGAALADGRNSAAWNGLARMCYLTGRAADASEALAKSAALAPHDVTAARDRSRLRLAAGDAAGAKMELEQALSKRPDDFDLLIDAARLDASLQRPVDAEKRFRRALEVRPDDEAAKEVARQGIAAALVDQAQAQCARDDLESARKAALAAAELVPRSSAPEQILGIVARRGGDLEEATVRFRKARDLFPEGVRIREALASVLLERAMAAFDVKSDSAGFVLAEEAVAADAPSVATRSARLDQGVGGWPAPLRSADERSTVTRQAALRGLTLLASGRAAEAASELVVAERGGAGRDADLRRNVLQLLAHARFRAGQPDDAVLAAEELPSLATPERPWQGWADLAAALVERGIARRGAADVAGAATDFDRARTTLDAAAAHGMPKSRWHLRRGEIHFAEERFVDATREFDRASDADPADPEPYIDRAAVFRTHFLLEEDKSYLSGAERDLRRALAVAARDPPAAPAPGASGRGVPVAAARAPRGPVAGHDAKAPGGARRARRAFAPGEEGAEGGARDGRPRRPPRRARTGRDALPRRRPARAGRLGARAGAVREGGGDLARQRRAARGPGPLPPGSRARVPPPEPAARGDPGLPDLHHVRAGQGGRLRRGGPAPRHRDRRVRDRDAAPRREEVRRSGGVVRHVDPGGADA